MSLRSTLYQIGRDEEGQVVDKAGENTESKSARRLLEDAALLYANKRLPSALLLLLCAVDALAPRVTGHGRVGERYISFLKRCLNDYAGPLEATRVMVPDVCTLEFSPGSNVHLENVKVPKTGEMLDFAHIIYTYMRNPIVHEGQTLDVRGDGVDAHVRLDFNDDRLVSRVDEDSETVVIGAPWLAKQLFVILNHELSK